MKTNTNTKIHDIIDYLEENEETFAACIEELDSWNGFLGDDRWYDMSELQDLLGDMDPIDLLNRAFFGHDADSWNDNSSFNPNRNYFSFNGYGNLVSSDEKDYSAFLDEYLVNDLAENRCHIYAIDDDPELAELFDALESDEDDDAENPAA